MWFVWSSWALAGTPVIYDDADTTSPLAFVSERTGLPEDQLDAVEVDTLLEAPPQAVGDATLRRCARQLVDTATVRTELARAEASWGDHDPIGAVDHLDLAVAGLGCLSAIVERPVAARVFVFRGGLAAERADEEQARSELRSGVAFQEDVRYSERYPVVGAGLLEEERMKPRSATIKAIPPTHGSGPWLDGRLIEKDGITVRPGLHLLQYAGPTGIRSGWLAVGGDAAVVVPTSLRGTVIDAMADAGTHETPVSLIRATIPELQAAYVVHDGGLWLLTAEGGSVTTLEMSPPASRGDGGKKGKKKKK